MIFTDKKKYLERQEKLKGVDPKYLRKEKLSFMELEYLKNILCSDVLVELLNDFNPEAIRIIYDLPLDKN